jgi:YbgC/YbaW family acyl-CoA thioester hydrolase
MDFPHFRQASEVAFGDTDASGWMHFPNIFRHVEKAEHEFLRSRGVLVFDRGQGGWPRVRVECDYKRPLQTGDSIIVDLAIAKLGAASVTWNFEVLNAAGEVAATGSMTTVRVGHDGRPCIISDAEREALTTISTEGNHGS